MLVCRSLLLLVLATAMLSLVSDARAQKDPPTNTPKPAQKAAQAKAIAITPEREAAVNDFVERNHPELGQLLSHLKSNQPKEYERAVRDLFRVTEKLAMVHERDERQYDLELKSWQAQSRAQLLVARMKMTDPASADSEELKKQLRDILTEQWQARVDVQRLERDRVTGRLTKLNTDIERMERDREAIIEGHLKSLTNANGLNAKARNKAAEKPADKAAEKLTDKKPREKPVTDKPSAEKSAKEQPAKEKSPAANKKPKS